MKYSAGFRDSVLKKVLPPESRSVGKVAEEAGIAQLTIRNWLARLESGTLKPGEGETSPNGKSAVEKLRLLLEGRQIPEADRGSWLRERGLHDEHLPLYEQELVGLVSENSDKAKRAVRDLKRENIVLKRDLRRKDAALAEMGALIVLKKKAEAIWGVAEDDSSESKSDK